LSPSRCIPDAAGVRRSLAGWATFPLAAAAASVCLATPAAAHGFGQRYDLPIPLSFYLFGTAAAVVVTFVIVGLFVHEAPRAREHARIDLLATRFGRLIASPALVWTFKLLALLIFIVFITAGFAGDQNPYKNIAPTMVWIIGWVGVAYVSAFIGNVWIVFNPWRTLFELPGLVTRRNSAIAELSLRRPYPAALGMWPAFILLLALSWIELVYPNPAVPHFLAWLALVYSALTLAGLFLFGEAWLARGEVFTGVFGTFARFSPVEVHTGARPQLKLRPFGTGLLDSSAVSTSMIAFVLLLLASVLHDGALATPEWGRLESALAAYLSTFGEYKLMVVRTAGLVAFWLVFFGTYLAISAVMSTAAGGALSPLAVARQFALTLVPIAIGYHLAHYLTFLLIQGQYIIPLISDPFGFGWNLFGTASYRVDIGIVDARFAWYAAVAAILIGHVAAVYLAHRKAIEVLDTRAAALRSQIALTALMVAYTFVSLSILAEPIVERRAPAKPLEAELSIPADAVLPEPGTGQLLPVGPGKIAGQKLIYRALASAFHDGTRMNAADFLYSYMFAFRWGGAGGDVEALADARVAAATALMRAQLMGLRIVGTDTTSKSFRFGDFEYIRELFVVEVYTSAASVDPEQDAVVAPPWSTLPWHLLVLMEEAVSRGWAAFSQEEAARRRVEWLDLVRSQGLNGRLASLVQEFERQGYRPEQLSGLVSNDAAQRRWAALAAFYKERGHFLVTNGPYQLKRWSPDSVTLDAFRDLSYPLGVGSYDAYAIPRRGFITRIQRDQEGVRIFGDIELVQKHARSYDIVRNSLESLGADVIKRSAPECPFIVTDEEGHVVLAGRIAIGSDASCHLDLTDKLAKGRYTLSAQLIVNGNAMNAEITRFVIVVPSPP
jgi:hypothetical protein